jgi:excisionase family DNA binding protein
LRVVQRLDRPRRDEKDTMSEKTSPMTLESRTAAPLEILTVPETAAFLRLPEGTVYRMLARGEIRGTLLARRWRVRRSDLVALFAGAPAAPAQPPPVVVTSAPRVGRPGRPRKA